MTVLGYEAAVAYVKGTCVHEDQLIEAVGGSSEAFGVLKDAKIVPDPTYRVTTTCVVSSVATLGVLSGAERPTGYFGPAVAPWLRRAMVMAESVAMPDLTEALQEWLARDFAAALSAQARDARAHGWKHLLLDDEVDRSAVREEVRSLWGDWMDGGWAVCLKRFDGRHLATKEIERQRIAQLMAVAKTQPAAGHRLDLLDAIQRLDAVLLPFAPHERAGGTPGLFIETPVKEFQLPWPTAELLAGQRNA